MNNYYFKGALPSDFILNSLPKNMKNNDVYLGVRGTLTVGLYLHHHYIILRFHQTQKKSPPKVPIVRAANPSSV